MVTIKDIRVGSIVRLRPGFGKDAQTEVEVTGIGREKGFDVVDYEINGSLRWAYIDQVDEVVKY